MRSALLALALLACGCAAANVYRAERDLDELTAMVRASLAASRSGGGLVSRERGTPAIDTTAQRVATAAAPADSAWLRWTTPATTALGCGDSAGVQRDAVHASIMRLRGQAAAWRPGCEAVPACWDSVRAQTTPDTVWSAWAVPGARCSVRVGAGEYVAEVTRSRCREWRVVRVQ